MNPRRSFGDGRERDLPPSPIRGSDALVPLRTWAEIHEEHRHHGIEFDAFWYESLSEGVCFFYRWQWAPRAIVLVVLDGRQLRHIEYQKDGDVELGAEESAPIAAEVVRAFPAESIWARCDRPVAVGCSSLGKAKLRVVACE